MARKQALLLALALILAGCGGSSAPKTQVVRGDGYRFEAPGGWKVKRGAHGASASHGDVDFVGVSTFRLQKPYRPELFAAASRELDRVARDLATQLGGRVSSSENVRAGGRDARSYRIAVGDRAEQVTFVLRGLREYQLICRRGAKSSDDACRALVRSFALL